MTKTTNHIPDGSHAQPYALSRSHVRPLVLRPSLQPWIGSEPPYGQRATTLNPQASD
jgi:hypothetical protein